MPFFKVEVVVTGVELGLGPNESLVPGKAHWHATMDGQGLPHALDEEVSRYGGFALGKHRLQVALYVNDADAVEVASDTIEFIIAEPDVPTPR